MLRLLFAAVALVSSWFWMRAEFSRVIQAGETIRPAAFAVRGAVLLVSAIWFVAAIFGVLGSLIGLILVAVVVGFGAKFLLDGIQMGRAELERRKAQEPAKTEPDDGA